MFVINMDEMDRTLMKVELHDHINRADDKELELMYFMWLNNEHATCEWWKDEELLAELKKRSEALRSGEDKGFPWEEVMGKLFSTYYFNIQNFIPISIIHKLYFKYKI